MTFEEALSFRHACKIFDEKKQIKGDEFNQILRAGILAPSSMGMQPWEFEVIKEPSFRLNLRAVCYNQAQITSASELVVIYAKIADLMPGSNYVKTMILARTDKTKEQQGAYLGFYANMLENNEGLGAGEIFAWSRAQCYLAAQNMMMQAAVLGIDSCAIEGFERGKLQGVLGHSDDKRVALILAFGYRVKEPQIKLRREFSQVVRFR